MQTANCLDILVELAGFYENLVGDDRRALKLWQRLVSKAPAHFVQRISAKRAIARIEDRQRRLADLKRELNDLRIAAVQPGHRDKPAFLRKMARQRKQLDQMANHFTLAADINYTLGLTHLALGHFFRADLCFGRVLAQFPAFGFQQPIVRLRKTARQSWIRCLCQHASWAVLAVFWLVTAIGMAWSRPWYWLRWHHIGAGMVAILIWITVFQIMLQWPGRQSQAAEFVNRDGFYPTPTYVPLSDGAVDYGIDEDDTASWGMRADYNLPSVYGLEPRQGQVFWPTSTDDLFYLVEADGSSDHRMVWMDLSVIPDADELGALDEIEVSDWSYGDGFTGDGTYVGAGTTHLSVISWLHFYDTDLGTQGAAFEAYLAQDRKMLVQSEAILASAVRMIKAKQPKIVLVPGDLTKDGERSSHEKFAAHLADLEAAGIQVLVCLRSLISRPARWSPTPARFVLSP